MKCKNCQIEFERTEEYINQKSFRTDPIFKWKLEYCDVCTDKKVVEGLKSLPAVLKVLSDLEENKDKEKDNER